MTLEAEPTSMGVTRSDGNRETGEVEKIKTKEAPPRLSTFFAEQEDTQSWRYVTDSSLKAIAPLISPSPARSSPTAHDPLRVQSSSRLVTTASTTVNVSSSTFLNSTSAAPPSSAAHTAPRLKSQTLSASSPALPTTQFPKTVQSVLDLLRSLKPQLDAILSIPVPTTGLESASAMSTQTRTGVAAKATQQKHRQKSVLRVTLDKMDVMQAVGPPQAKVKGNKKSKQIVEEIGAPSPSSSKTLRSLSSTDIVKEVGLFFMRRLGKFDVD